MTATIRRRVALVLTLITMLGFLATAAAAQDLGVIAGTVRDTTGAVLPGTTVTIVNRATQAQQATTADISGTYTVPGLAPGTYDVTATLSGFKDVTKQVTIAANQTVTTDLVLGVGGFGEQVTVTALKAGEQRLIDVPLAVSAVSSSQIEELGAKSVLDVAQLAPGAAMFEGSQPGQNRPQIRGISSSVGDATVGYYLDETSWSLLNWPSTPDTGMFDLERIEVLRGPQGTLYGDSAMGGVFRFITADPNLRKVDAKADISSSSYSGGEANYTLNGAVSVPIVKDRLALRATASYRKVGGWVDSTMFGEDVNKQDYGSYRVKLLWNATQNFHVRASAWSSRLNSDAPNNALDDGTTDVPFAQPNTFNYDIYSVVADYSTPKLSILNAASYLGMNAAYVTPLLFGPGATVPFGSDITSTVWSDELRLAYKVSPSFRFTAGTMYKNVNQPLGATMLGSVLADQVQTSESWAVFGEATYTAGRMDVTAGVRQFGDERRVEDHVQGMEAAQSFSATTPRFNVGVRAAKNTLLYANVAKGFRSGLVQNPFSIQIANMVGEQIPEKILPEDAWTYEGGFKTETANHRVSLEGAVYLTDYNSLQTWLPINGMPFTAGWNVGSAKIPGVDWSIRANPVDGLSLAFSGNWNDAHYAETVTANGAVVVEEGQRVVYVPEFTYVLSGRYSKPINRNWVAFGDLSMQHASGIFGNAAGDLSQSTDGINNAQFRAGIQHASVEITFFVENLTNERRPTAPAVFGGPWLPRLPPRAIGINFRVKN